LAYLPTTNVRQNKPENHERRLKLVVEINKTGKPGCSLRLQRCLLPVPHCGSGKWILTPRSVENIPVETKHLIVVSDVFLVMFLPN